MANNTLDYTKLQPTLSERLSDGGLIQIFCDWGESRLPESETEHNVFCLNSDLTLRWRVANHQPIEKGYWFTPFFEQIDTASGRLRDFCGSNFLVNLQTGELTDDGWNP
jgi:hypothetical protein